MKKNSDIKIIFTDVDWTILNHGHGKHVYDKKSLDALRKAQSNGVKVFISTARPHESLKITGFFDEFKPDGMILSNVRLLSKIKLYPIFIIAKFLRASDRE